MAVKDLKAFEGRFLMERDNNYSEILADFKKGKLADDSLKKVTELAKELTAQYK